MNPSLRCSALSALLFSQVILSATEMKTESFDHDPGWDGLNNHVTPKKIPVVTQDFGYKTSNFAGKERGEIGGQIWRSSTRASYAKKIPQKTLDDKLTASGTFAVTATSGTSGAFIGWFNSERTGNGRSDTLGLRFDGEGSGARITLQLVTDNNQACGIKVTPWVIDRTKKPGDGDRRFRPTPIKNDGTHYAWTLTYDPNANNGAGQFECTVRSESSKHDDFENKTFTVPLPAGYKSRDTKFDRFGLMNSERGGNAMTIYVDDLEVNGQRDNFTTDPNWIGAGNNAHFADREQGGAHDFGFCAKSNHAGGSPGELGGTIWRSGDYGYYGDRVGTLTLTNRLEARGKIILEAAPPDSGMYLGWFNGDEKENAPPQAGNFVGVRIGGPTRVGHYFVPAYATTQKDGVKSIGNREAPKRISVEPNEGPVLVPHKVFDWKLVYDPEGNNGEGLVEATLGSESLKLPLKKGDKSIGASLNHFGLFTTKIGGSYVRIYFDDIAYTTARSNQ